MVPRQVSEIKVETEFLFSLQFKHQISFYPRVETFLPPPPGSTEPSPQPSLGSLLL